MADKENICPRVTRAAAAAKKRGPTAVSVADQPPAKRKRVPLGEIPSHSNCPSRFPPLKPRTRSKSNKEAIQNAEPQPDPFDDPCNGDNPYASDIHTYLHSMETDPKRRPMEDFIGSVQNDVTASMRGVLVDWLVEVAEEYKLVSDTLYLTITYIDRFLSSNPLRRQKLQLLGVSCMLIASKYEEISPPHVEDFCYITDNTYTKQEVLNMEGEVLKFLNFELGNPTIKTFLRSFARAAEESGKYPSLQLEFLASYLAELSLLDYGCVGFLPSVIASSAVFVARFTIDPNSHPWSLELQRQTSYSSSELKECINTIHDLQLNRKGSTLLAIREKYKQHRFKCVSMLLSPIEIPASYFAALKG